MISNNNIKIQKLNWNGIKQIINVARLKLYYNSKKSKEKYFQRIITSILIKRIIGEKINQQKYMK
jgi:hypothetical protein